MLKPEELEIPKFPEEGEFGELVKELDENIKPKTAIIKKKAKKELKTRQKQQKAKPVQPKKRIAPKEKKLDLSNFNKILERKILINFYPSFKEIHKHLRENLCFHRFVLQSLKCGLNVAQNQYS